MSKHSLKEKVVYPGHGVAQVNRIVKKIISGKPAYFYELVFLHQDMTILVPIENAQTIGIRPLSSRESIEDLLQLLAEPVTQVSIEPTISNWNKRNKDYKEKLQTGDPKEICRIYRHFKQLSLKKELSFGEKDLLKQTETLLAEEIAEVHGWHEEVATEHIRRAVEINP